MEFFADSNRSFFQSIKELSGQPIDLCFQCQKCASACTMAGDADHSPNQILRMMQLGLEEEVLKSNSIWLCTGCEICGARCPNNIDSGEVMDALKETAILRNTISQEKIHLFNTIFLKNVKSSGRVNEGMMMARYKLKAPDLFSDMDYGLSMFLKGKISIFSKGIKEKQKVKKIFKDTVGS